MNNLEKLMHDHKKVSKEPFVPPAIIVADNASYVVFKDKKL